MPDPVPVDEGDERKELSHSVARTALLVCSRVLRRDFPNCHAVLASYIDEQESVRSERDAELRRAMAVTQAAIDWQADTGGCHFCGFGIVLGPPTRDVPHDAECPLVVNGFITPDG